MKQNFLSAVLMLIILLTGISTDGFAQRGKGHGHHKGHKKHQKHYKHHRPNDRVVHHHHYYDRRPAYRSRTVVVPAPAPRRVYAPAPPRPHVVVPAPVVVVPRHVPVPPLPPHPGIRYR